MNEDRAFPERRSKIVATIGPASGSLETLTQLALAGMNVARLNFSHGDHATHRQTASRVRQVSIETGLPIGVMQDLQGPKIRVGKLPEAGVTFGAKDLLVLYPSNVDAPQVDRPIPVNPKLWQEIHPNLKDNERVMFDDGKIVAVILKVEANALTLEAQNDGKLSSHKGMNLPDSPLSLPCLTEKDLEDLTLGMELKVDAVALSFVRTPEDIDILREEIAKRGDHRPMIFSKIERAEAMDCIDEIIEKSDGILVARGDMAVELGVEKVPGIQKQLIRLSHRAGIPSITATQMLESMTESPLPTRAEASDVANAIFDGSDAIMLSNETAVGAHPVRVVETMSRIAIEAEKASSQYGTSESLIPPRGSVVDSVEFSAGRIAEATGARALIPLTNSGRAAQVLSKYRPTTKILAMTDRENTFHRLAFFWGVHAVRIKSMLPTDDIFALVETELKRRNSVTKGDRLVITMGLPTMERGTTNTVRVHEVG